LFVSTRFLFPVDSGGKIRTTQVLRGLKSGAFNIVLISPATRELADRHKHELQDICDEFHWWPAPRRGATFRYTRMRHLLGPLPIPVRTDRHDPGLALVRRRLRASPTVAVFDFTHAAVLMPEESGCPSVMFTHNVEAEIFLRHREVARNPLLRAVWADQYRKMRRFEERALKRFDVVVAVSDRDAAKFVSEYEVPDPVVIPTGVDLDYFAYASPKRGRDVVFLGSMDWLANQEGVSWFMDAVWERIAGAVPDARCTVVGRSPPKTLMQEARRRNLNWRFTGFVDDVRPFVQGSAVSVIPLRVAGGTRLKVYEAMAMGSPVVSTAIGVEGLPVEPGHHYLEANDASAFAEAVIRLLGDHEKRAGISLAARSYVERHCSYSVAARAFESGCELAIERFQRARA
jgi:glycosyltransferase involved in cell wall biosynthesis